MFVHVSQNMYRLYYFVLGCHLLIYVNGYVQYKNKIKVHLTDFSKRV